MQNLMVKMVYTAKRAYIIGIDQASKKLYETLKEKKLILRERKINLMAV